MSNRSYLCGTEAENTYPSFVEPAYDSAEQTIACDVWCIPLLWMGMFRPEDIVRKTFTVDGQEVVTEAPLVARTKAIRQLKEALPYFNRLFASEGPLDEYAALLTECLEAVDFSYVTVEMQEIACLSTSEPEFYDRFRDALAAIGTDNSAQAKQRFCDIAAFRDLTRFPSARLLLDDDGRAPISDDDFWNHCRVCGAGEYNAGIGRAVPWEPS